MLQRSHILGLLIILGLGLGVPALGQARDQRAQPAAHPPAQTQPLNRAALVVQHGDGSVVTSCVSFAEPSISGLELLRRSGLSIITQGSSASAAVCSIDGEGCAYPAEDCFCQCKGSQCIYWAYSLWRENQWAYAPLGASSVQVQPGQVNGWAWGPGTVQYGPAPPPISFEQVCALQPTTPAARPPMPAPATPRPVTAVAPAVTSTPAAASAVVAQATTAPSNGATSQNSSAVGSLDTEHGSIPLNEPSAEQPAPIDTSSLPAPLAPTTSRQVETSAPTGKAPVPSPTTAQALPTSPPTVASATFMPPTSPPAAGVSVLPTPAGADQPSASSGGYLAFGALALLLIAGIVAASIRQRL